MLKSRSFVLSCVPFVSWESVSSSLERASLTSLVFLTTSVDIGKELPRSVNVLPKWIPNSWSYVGGPPASSVCIPWSWFKVSCESIEDKEPRIRRPWLRRSITKNVTRIVRTPTMITIPERPAATAIIPRFSESFGNWDTEMKTKYLKNKYEKELRALGGYLVQNDHFPM